MEAAAEIGAERIESFQWLRDFADRYDAAWTDRDAMGVASCVAEDIVWEDPALPEPARSRAEVAEFVEATKRAIPDYQFIEPSPPAIAEDGMAAYVPWHLTGTNTGPIDPPGFAPTGKRIDVSGIDVWEFRGGLIWRYSAVYDFATMARQLGLLPPRGGAFERVSVQAQRLRSKLPV